MQQKSDINTKITGLLMVIKNKHRLNQREIAKEIGIDENHLSKVSLGQSNGSPQMLAALELLLDYCDLLKRDAALLEIENLQKRIDLLKQGKEVAVSSKEQARLSQKEQSEINIKRLLEERRRNREKGNPNENNGTSSG